MKRLSFVAILLTGSLLLSAFAGCGGDTPVAPNSIPSVVPDDSEDEQESDDSGDGGNIIGKVTAADGSPIARVAVSDGIIVTATDENGKYRLKSDKSCGYVFISLPSGYMPEMKGNIPQISQLLTTLPSKSEIHNFTLFPTKQDDVTLVIHADQHLANRTTDLEQFRTKVLPDMNDFIFAEQNSGRKVYSLTLGDLSWDQFWKANSFDLIAALEYSAKIECPIFHSIGNHDNNPFVSDDWYSSAVFRMNVAPTYYSFNIGEAHIIMLDNIIYNNPGASSSEMGDRSYDRALTDTQLRWLDADLATISDKSRPIIICAHVPFYGEPTLYGNDITTKRNMLNTEQMESIIAPFENVTLFTGHYHRNYSVRSPYLPNVIEHNLASLSGSLWWTATSGYSSNHICTDGTPGGYGILRIKGKEIDYSYKGVGLAEDYKFRIYDLNSVQINESCVTSSSTYKNMVKDYADIYYNKHSDNLILVNVFTWQPGWKVEIMEESTPLTVSRARVKDPLHIMSYEIQRLNHSAVPTSTSTFTTQYSAHFFQARASKADSPVTVRVTDNRGRVYEKTISRPYIFTY